MRIADKNFSLIIFGASGALAKYKIFPALYQMALEGRMPASYNVIGFARTKKSHQEFREEFKESICSKNPDVDMKILDPDYDELHKRLKRFRNSVFHTEKQYWDMRQFELMQVDSVVRRIRYIHDRLGESFLEVMREKKK